MPYIVHVLNKLYAIKHTKVKYSFDAKPTCNNISVTFTKLLIYIPPLGVSGGKKPGDFQLPNLQNCQTFDPGRVFHSYFKILNAFHLLTMPVPFAHWIPSNIWHSMVERLANAYIVIRSEETCNMAIEVTLTFRILGHIYYMHNSCLT
jgi:hypothetical protein